MNTLPRKLSRFVITDDCWLWTGHIDKDGYGKVKYKGKMEQAHRIIYEVYNNVILTKRTHVHHDKCKNKHCVNPEHMIQTHISTHNTLHKSKINDDLGKEIIRLYVEMHMKPNRIAKKYELSCTTVTTFLDRAGVRDKNLYKVS